MSETIDVKSLMRISKFAKIIDKSPAWVRKIGEDGDIDIVEIDGFFFVRVNDKFQKYLKK